MSFAFFQNGSPTATSSAAGTTNRKKVGQTLTFPNIEGRDAPGKTGNAAKPALLDSLGLYVGGEPTQVRFGVWNSNGINLGLSQEFSPFGDILNVATIQKPVVFFSGTSYRVGLGVTSTTPTGAFTFGHMNTGVTAKFDVNVINTSVPPGSTQNDFVSSGSAANGSMNYVVYYDVLPTQPLSLAAELLSPTNPEVRLTWDSVSSDGGQAVSGYRIQISTDNSTWTTLVANTNSTSRTYTTSELAFGFTYYFRVAAINLVALTAGSDYSGPYSNVVSSLVASVAGNGQSFLTATVDNPDPEPLTFTDFGPGIRFTSIDVQYGSEFLYNEITASTQGTASVLQTTDAPKSKALYGVRTYSVTNLLNSTDVGAFEVAKDYLTYFYQPELRVQSITVDLANLTIEEKLQVLALEIDSYISVSFTPNGIGDPKITSGLVTGIAHSITLTSHQVELRLRNERTLFTIDSDSKGILNVNILGP
jgi:hypothetical protein